MTNSRSGAIAPCATRACSCSTDDGRDQLSNEVQAGIQIKDQAAALHLGENLDEPNAGSAVRHQRYGGALIVEPVDLANARVIGVFETRESRDALAQRKIERRNVGYLVTEAQNFQRRVVVARATGLYRRPKPSSKPRSTEPEARTAA